ncbi:hypothetical protein HME9302_00509 [Alteripontixanthobacter maritimus]|uniref:FAS1 domain-containing protein n=1 Tax=Alteripontixanthobacter maritimus TaxID=2161824 RepID=A0A369Q495_9SPHN|nr:fasciclin domain-containing protein [Alteripontixanthobacter maritimus]RDC59322.1 hypothetical protein HME9302_00509 [Alteripontixanthobacter maritimus]
MSRVFNHRRILAGGIVAASLLSIAACTEGSDVAPPATGMVNQTLASVIGGSRDMRGLSGALSSTGLAMVLDGPGSYTLLAPDSEAFAELDDMAEALAADERAPLLAATLRNHMLPGHLTPDTIRDAITATGGPVEIRTLGSGTMTFDTDGKELEVTGPDGTTTTLTGNAIEASNGVLLQLDGMAMSVGDAPSAS